ncbi:MAG: hypothetical protein IJY41_03280 [Clostridia bacterium]|nr:hypothetical protein [Clostridia bacterium]
MNLSMRISKKTQKNDCKCKLKIKKIISKAKVIKYDLLIAIETVSLLMAALACLFRRDKDSSFFASISSIISAYLVLCATYRLKSHSESKKYEGILSADKNEEE